MTPAKQPAAWRRYLRFWGSNVREDVDDELQFHVEMRTREYIARGMDAQAARIAVARRLGDVGAAAHECLEIGEANARRQRQANVLDSLASDARYAVRSFARSPGWTTVALLTMALGIGASTSVLSVIDGLLLRPISYPHANRVATVTLDVMFGAGRHVRASPTPATLDAWRTSARSIEQIEGYARRELSLAETPGAEPLHAALIGDRFLNFAGATPVVGRLFSSDEASATAPTVAMLAEPYWRREFGGSRDVVGKVIHANGQSLTIVGVLPATLRLPDLEGDQADVWLPLSKTRDQRFAGVVARLRAGVSTQTAAAELDAIMKRAADDPLATQDTKVQLVRPSDTLGFRTALQMLAGAVALLLLVACANVSHLSLARGASRERELAVRYALGAGRSRLVWQLLTESLLLSAAGGILASAVGATALAVVRAAHPSTLPALGTVRVDRSLFAIAAALTSVTGVAIGLLVAFRVARSGIADALRLAGGERRASSRLRSALVVSEIGLSATLLVGALLLVRSVISLQSVSPGLDPRGVYAMTLPLRGAGGDSRGGQLAFARRLLDRTRALPGVTAATLAGAVPFRSPMYLGAFETPEHPGDPANPTTSVANSVAPDYFAVTGISFVAGRTFDAGAADRNEVIVDEVFAKQLWPSELAVGKRFRIASNGPGDAPTPWWTVIGVTKSVLAHGLLDGTPSPAVYSPLEQAFDRGRIAVIARWSGGSAPAATLRRLGAELAPGGPPPTVTNLSQLLRDSIAEPRFSMIVLAAFAGLAVLLAAVGLYGVVAYSVTQRTREIGIRMTLGATRQAIARLVIGDGLRLSCAGIVLGLAGAVAATRVIQIALYGVGRGDLTSFAVGAVGLLTISLIACVVPVMRATAVDPAIAVRAD